MEKKKKKDAVVIVHPLPLIYDTIVRSLDELRNATTYCFSMAGTSGPQFILDIFFIDEELPNCFQC